MSQRDIYDPEFVASLFDEMAQTYGVVNLISSFGFARRWRRQCLREVEITECAVVVDLMTGMGELCPDLLSATAGGGTVTAVDLSPVMCQRARRHAKGVESRFRVIEADALHCPIDDASIDCVVSTFGLKTLDSDQLQELAREVARMLRPGGQFAFLEISIPGFLFLRWLYVFYLKHVIPMIGRLALGNPDNYRMLGVYTSAFGNCRTTADAFAEAGLSVEFKSYFFGCASGVSGAKGEMARKSGS